MTKYIVSYPIVGNVEVIVEADSEQDAIRAGWDKCADDDAHVEWEPVERVTSGNVLHAPQNEIYVEEQE